MWGLSDEETVNAYTPIEPTEHEEGEVIESVLDHRRKQGKKCDIIVDIATLLSTFNPPFRLHRR